MPDAPSLILSQGSSNPPVPHPEDNSPLLVSRIPGMPSHAEIEKLLSAPSLSYEEARGSWTEEDRRKPVRVFCEVCGYWGRVRCMRCGGKVCALECLSTHQEECFTKYGA
jgi:zinc finger HIT domain-containing protein 1